MYAILGDDTIKDGFRAVAGFFMMSDLSAMGDTRINSQNSNGKSNTQTGQLDPRTLLHKRYVVMQTIGQGGMAAVYQARDTRKGTLCAIKEMSLVSHQNGSDPDFVMQTA
jgi:serine/threonine protein kinase